MTLELLDMGGWGGGRDTTSYRCYIAAYYDRFTPSGNKTKKNVEEQNHARDETRTCDVLHRWEIVTILRYANKLDRGSVRFLSAFRVDKQFAVIIKINK